MVKRFDEPESEEQEFDAQLYQNGMRPVKLEVDPYLPESEIVAPIEVIGLDEENPIILDEDES